jgi:hypothetical protein
VHPAPQLQKFQARIIRRRSDVIYRELHVNPLLKLGRMHEAQTLTEKEIRDQARNTAIQGASTDGKEY